MVVGPWITEPGYEVLYWVPWVRALLAEAGVDPGRVTVVSRGGVGAWYHLQGATYRDVYEVVSGPELRTHTANRVNAGMRQTQKHLDVSSFDAMVLRALGQSGKIWVHPSRLYRWLDERPTVEAIEAMLLEPPLPARVDAPMTAVKFYASRALPATPENRAHVAAIVAALEGHVAVLEHPESIDDHESFPLTSSALVRRIRATMPVSNLAIQTAMLQGCREFVGTCGGFAFVAMTLGVPVRSFWSEGAGWNRRHLELAQRRAARSGVPFHVGPIAEWGACWS